MSIKQSLLTRLLAVKMASVNETQGSLHMKMMVLSVE